MKIITRKAKYLKKITDELSLNKKPVMVLDNTRIHPKQSVSVHKIIGQMVLLQLIVLVSTGQLHMPAIKRVCSCSSSDS